MATMVPKNVEIFTTEGEKQFYRFLESIVKPDFKYIACYTPDLKRNEPDFVLYQIINTEDLCRAIKLLFQREIF